MCKLRGELASHLILHFGNEFVDGDIQAVAAAHVWVVRLRAGVRGETT